MVCGPGVHSRRRPAAASRRPLPGDRPAAAGTLALPADVGRPIGLDLDLPRALLAAGPAFFDPHLPPRGVAGAAADREDQVVTPGPGHVLGGPVDQEPLAGELPDPGERQVAERRRA